MSAVDQGEGRPTGWIPLITEWDRDLSVICHGHYDAAGRIAKRNYQLGIPVVVLSSVVGATIFVGHRNEWLDSALGLASLAAGVLAALQTFLKFAERAEKHREAGARYGALLKELEQAAALPPTTESLGSWCSSFRERWDAVSLESPTVPTSIWRSHYEKHKRLSANAGPNTAKLTEKA